jgi:uncharacterized membrane protein
MRRLSAFSAQRERLIPNDPLIETAGRLNELAGINFAQGLRDCYYAVPILLWLVNGWLFIIGTVATTMVCYCMVFLSETVKALAAQQGAPTRPEP